MRGQRFDPRHHLLDPIRQNSRRASTALFDNYIIDDAHAISQQANQFNIDCIDGGAVLHQLFTWHPVQVAPSS